MQSKKTPYIIIGLLLSIVISVGLYIYFQTNEVDFPLKKYSLIILGSICGIFILGVIIYKIISSLDSSNKGDMVTPKEYVATRDALNIWRQEFIIDNKIPHRVKKDGKEQIIESIDPDAVEIRNTKSHVDENMQTADQFLMFEVIVRAGQKQGMLIAIVPLDLGKEYIKNNWQFTIQWNRSQNTYDPESRRYPKTSAKNYQERLSMLNAELVDDGWSKKEAGEMVNPFMQNGKQIVVAPDSPRRAISSPSIKEEFPNFDYDDQDESVDIDDVQADIEAFRKNNK